MVLVHASPQVADEMMISPKPPLAVHADPLDERGEALAGFVPVWNGVLHEFRNHLTVLLAAATELRAAIPPAMALDVAEAVTETERNVQNLNSLVALVDAVVKTGEPLISDLDEMIERALRIAAPALGRRVSVSVAKGRKAGARNRGTALECLLAALIVDLARAVDVKPADGARRPQIQIHVEIGRGSLLIEIESSGARPPPGSWRLLLASDLAAKLDATVMPLPDMPGYAVQFR
jgi:hypothetical protein